MQGFSAENFQRGEAPPGTRTPCPDRKEHTVTTETFTPIVGKKYRLRIDPAAVIPDERMGADEFVGMKISQTSHHWVLFWPMCDGENSRYGWLPTAYLSDSEIESLGEGTDWRGWYVADDMATVLGEYETELDFSAETSEFSRLVAQNDQLKSDLAALGVQVSTLTDLVNSTVAERDAARQQRDRWCEQVREAEVKYDRMIERIQTEGEREAAEHGWCSTYDRIMERLGLEGREREWRVAVRLTWDTYITVTARSADDAENLAGDAELMRNWRPTSPFEGYSHSGVEDLEFEVREVEEND